MERITFSFPFTLIQETELSEPDSALIAAARRACLTAYAPYSRFHVGAAALLENGETVCGSNQENASFTVGTCAERCTLYYANARFPGVAVRTLAIAACKDDGIFIPAPITPCGACRQALIEIEQKQRVPMRLLLYGSEKIYCIEKAADLLPLHFGANTLDGQ